MNKKELFITSVLAAVAAGVIFYAAWPEIKKVKK